MDSAEDDAGSDAVAKFLTSPAHHYEEDVDARASDAETSVAPSTRLSFRGRLRRFLFEKKPSGYSSIAPRQADGTRTKIFYFNGNGRGR